MDKFYLGVANNNIAKSMGFNQTGWHRIAKYSFIDDTDSVFRGSNGCDIIINCMDINAFYLSETYALRLLVGGDSSILSLSGCMGRDEGDSLNSKRYLTKVRHTLNINTKEAYIEVYIPELGTNNYYVLINNGADQFHYWEPIDPISVEETVEGFNTYSEIELPLESFGTASHDSKGKVFEEYYYHKDNKPSKSDVGLGNVPNVATNDQTPTYSEASSLAKLTSGEKLSVAFGKIAKGITDLISHLSSTSNPHSVTKTQVGLGNVNNTSDANKPVSTAQATSIADAKKAGTNAQSNLTTHIGNKSNPHSVKLTQLVSKKTYSVSTNENCNANTSIDHSDYGILSITAKDESGGENYLCNLYKSDAAGGNWYVNICNVTSKANVASKKFTLTIYYYSL